MGLAEIEKKIQAIRDAKHRIIFTLEHFEQTLDQLADIERILNE